MSPEKPIRGQVELTKDTAPVAVSLRAISDSKSRGRLRAASIVDAIKASLTKWVDSDGWTYEFENLPRVTISEKDIKRAASTVDLKVWDASNTLIFRDRIHAWDGFPVLVPDGTQRQEILDTGEINLVDNFKEDPLEAVKTDLAHTVRVVTKTGTVPWVKAKPGTVSTFYSGTSDGYLVSVHATYATARSTYSGGTSPSDTATSMVCGQQKPGDFQLYEMFVQFDTSAIDDGDTVSQAVLSLYGTVDLSTTDFTAEARVSDWGASLTTADWIAGGSLSSLTRVATHASAGFTTSAYNDFTEDGLNFRSAVNTTGATRLILVSDRLVAGTEPTGNELWIVSTADETGTTQDPKLVVTHTAATPPTITSGPTTTYASGTCTTPTVTWGITFTATDAEQTGSDALTYYIRTSSTFGGGTQVATGTCTSGSSKAVTGLAYNASGVVEGTQTLYLHIYDGALNTVTASSFTLVRRFIKSVAGTGGTLSGALSRISAKALTGTSGALSGALSRVTNKSLSGISGTLSSSLVADFISGGTEYLQSLAGAVGNLIGTTTKKTTLSMAGVVGNISGTISRVTLKALIGATATLSATLTKATLKSLSGAVGILSGILTTGKTTALALAGAISAISGTMSINIAYARALAGELSSVLGNVSRSTLKVLSGASGAVSGALSSIRIFSQVLAGEIATITGSITRFVTKSFSGVITGSGILSTAASFYRTVTGSLSSLSGEFSFKYIIRRVKMKGGSVVRSVIGSGSRRLR